MSTCGACRVEYYNAETTQCQCLPPERPGRALHRCSASGRSRTSTTPLHAGGVPLRARPRSLAFRRANPGPMYCTYGSSAPLHTVLLAVTSPPRSRSIMPHAYPKDTPPRPTALALRLQIASPCICLHLPASRPSPADAGIEGHMDMSSTGRSPKRRKSASLPVPSEGPIRAVRVLCPCPVRRVSTGRPSPCTYRG
jgi:hypothetical protein